MQRDIKSCRKCSSLGYSCPTAPPVFKGKNYDGTVVIGESPHISWLESGSPFHNKNGKLTPSAKRILEYLEILGKTPENIVLLEAAKCVVRDRKDLAKMITNCQDYLIDQIKEYDPKIVVSFGKAVSDSLSVQYAKEFIPCGIYKLGSFTYISLFHPSPANPTGHKRNLEFLAGLNNGES